MFYSKPLLSLSFFLVLFFPPPSFRQLWIENKPARHVSRHNHRALSGMIKFSTARLTEFPSGGERSPESGKMRREKRSLAFIIAVSTDFFPPLCEFRVQWRPRMRQISLIINRFATELKEPMNFLWALNWKIRMTRWDIFKVIVRLFGLNVSYWEYFLRTQL